MARLLRILFLTLLLTLPLVAMMSRENAVETAQAVPIIEQSPEVNPIIIQPERTAAPEGTPEPTPFITATPTPAPNVSILLNVRNDLELLADVHFGAGNRPEGWTGAVNQFDPQIGLLTRLDLEFLASSLINPDIRPTGWIGAVGSTPFAIARDTRHDLELLAEVAGFRGGERPGGWIGADPLFSCNRSTQTLVNLLERGGIYRLQIEPNDPDFCYKAEIDVTRFTETQILANAQIGELFSNQLTILSPASINSSVAVAFLDSAATRRVGVIPPGTPIRPIARSRAEFSRMMLVRGDNFEVFVEYTSTTLTQQQYRNLPNANSLEVRTFCNASWCDTN